VGDHHPRPSGFRVSNVACTAFAGHIHRYQKYVRNGQNYYQLATTGGDSRMRGVSYGEFDHITWVTVKKNGPVLANILLYGVYPEDMRQPLTRETGHTEINRKATHPVRGTVYLDGSPAVGARVQFHLINPDTKKTSPAGDGLIEADGSFFLTTYSRGDGTPAGDYVVTIGPWGALFGDLGKGAAACPEKYAKPTTSTLKATVKAGKNEFVFEMTK